MLTIYVSFLMIILFLFYFQIIIEIDTLNSKGEFIELVSKSTLCLNE